MPRTPATWGGAAGLWVTVAGWAAAAHRRFGDAVVLTPGGALSLADCLEASGRAPRARANAHRYSAALTSARTLVGDFSRFHLARNYCRYLIDNPPPDDSPTRFVWSHHDLFHAAPYEMARRFDVPLVAYVHAPVVWEAARWGVRRPGWGVLLERYVESPLLRRADLVACASEDVREAALRLGADEKRTLVSPMAVDADRFAPSVDGTPIRRALGIDDRFVIGWVGSFRRFHGIDLAVSALARLRSVVPEATLMFVGDGFERAAVEQQVYELGLSSAVRFVGQISNESLPQFVRAFDVAVLTAHEGQSFHYSPLKLREYMASGLAVVAPRIGELARILEDGTDALLYAAGDVDALAGSLARVAADRRLAASLGEAARAFALSTSTWDSRLDQILARLEAVSVRLAHKLPFACSKS